MSPCHIRQGAQLIGVVIGLTGVIGGRGEDLGGLVTPRPTTDFDENEPVIGLRVGAQAIPT